MRSRRLPRPELYLVNRCRWLETCFPSRTQRQRVSDPLSTAAAVRRALGRLLVACACGLGSSGIPIPWPQQSQAGGAWA